MIDMKQKASKYYILKKTPYPDCVCGSQKEPKRCSDCIIGAIITNISGTNGHSGYYIMSTIDKGYICPDIISEHLRPIKNSYVEKHFMVKAL